MVEASGTVVEGEARRSAAEPQPTRRRVGVPPKHPVPHHIARFVLRPIFRIYFRMRAEGLHHLPRQGAYLIAPNHVSMLDWAFVSYFLRKLTRFVVHREYYDHPLMGFGLRVNGAIPVRDDRPDAASLRVLRVLLEAGEPLILFPEGRISLNGRPGPVEPGILSLAAATHTPIVPVAIRGAYEAFPRWRRLPRPGRVTVVFGAPLPPPPPGGRLARQEQAVRLTRHLTQLLAGEDPAEFPW